MCHVRAFENGKRFGLVLSDVPLMFFSRMPDFDMHSSHDLLPHAPCARHIVSSGPGCLHRYSSIIGLLVLFLLLDLHRYGCMRFNIIQMLRKNKKKRKKKGCGGGGLWGWGQKFICRVWSLTNLRTYFVSQVSRRELNDRENSPLVLNI